MKRISYIAMIATAAFCQLSSCMNQPNNPVNGNQSSPAVRTVDIWSLKLPSDFSAKSVQAKNRVVEVDFDKNEVRISATMGINISFDGSEVMGSTSLSFVRTRLHSAIQVPGGNQRASSAPFMGMRQSPEMKEEKEQQKMNNQTKARSDSELSEILKESKPPKTPKSLDEIVDLNSDTEELDKKKTNETGKIDRKSFLNKYAEKSLDNEVQEQIKALFDRGITSTAEILDRLSPPSDTITREKNYDKVWRKVNAVITKLKKQKGKQ